MRAFEERDLAEINSWYRMRALPPLELSHIPKTGLIEPDIAAGFLFKTDSRVCLLDNYVANPRASPEDRGLAIERLTEALLDAARAGNFRHVVAITKTQSIANRARKLGFKTLGTYSLLVKEV